MSCRVNAFDLQLHAFALLNLAFLAAFSALPVRRFALDLGPPEIPGSSVIRAVAFADV